jgi:hypothetical protein
MYSLQINQRIFPGEGIEDDDSVRLIFYDQVADWQRVKEWHSGIAQMPISQEWRAWLKDHIYRGPSFFAYLVDRPTIAIYRWPDKQERWFLVTRNSNLLEPSDYVVWDSFFPCILRQESGFSLRVPRQRVRQKELGNIAWFPNQVNFTHFLIDSFAPLALLDQSLAMYMRDKFFVPLLGCPPSWQQEYLDKLSLKQISIGGVDSSCDLLLLKPQSVILPLFSCKPAAYLPLREFLYARSPSAADDSPTIGGTHLPVMLTRHDNRRNRVRNIDQIEKLIESYGGLVVDPSKLSIEQRFRMIQRCSLCISEGSGTTNALVFGGDSCGTINLCEPNVFSRRDLLVGGWPYLIHRSNSTQFIRGTSRLELDGSPLGSAYYPLDWIEQLLTSHTLSIKYGN